MMQNSENNIKSHLKENRFMSGNFSNGFFLGCKLCSRKFSSTKLLRNHKCVQLPVMHIRPIETNQTATLEILEKYEEKTKMQEIEAEPKTREMLNRCHICELLCNSNEFLEDHMKTHKNYLPFNCQYTQNCKEIFNREILMRDHMLAEHNTIVRPATPLRFKCNVCDYVGTKPNVRVHIKRHTTEKNTLCPICGKCLKNKEYLPDHLAIHNDIYNYKCLECPKAYATQTSLSSHITQTHRSKTKNHSCEDCGYSCYSKSALKLHITKHTGEKKHSCREGCDKRFRLIMVRNYHERTHSGIPSFKCTLCSKVLTTRYNLKLHILIHQGSKRFQCSTCDHSYVDGASARKCKHSKLIKRQ